MAFADNYWSLMVTTSLFVFATAILTPAVSSLTSKRADTQQGMAMGLSNSFMSLGRIAGPLWAGFVFDINLIFPYISGAVTMLIGFIISLVWLKGAEPATVSGMSADHHSPS